MPVNTVTRFPGGHTNLLENHPFADLRKSDETVYHTQFEDFDRFTAGDWVITTVGTGTSALTAGDGGLLLLTNSAASGDAKFLQWAGGSGAALPNFLLQSGLRTFFESRFKVDNATLAQYVVGMQVTDTTPLDVTDGIYFLHDTTANANLSFVVGQNATTGRSRTDSVFTVGNDTFLTVSWYWDGINKVQFGVNGLVLGAVTATASTFLPDTALELSFGVQNGSAVIRTMTMDYLYIAQERLP